MSAIAGVGGPADDEDGVLAGDGAEDLRPALRVDRLGDRLGAARQRMKNDQLADSIDSREPLR